MRLECAWRRAWTMIVRPPGGTTWRRRRGRSAGSTTKRAVATSCVPAFRDRWRSSRPRVLHVRDGVPDRARELRHGLARRPRVHRPRVDAGGDGQGQLVGRRHRRRPRERRAARRDHRDRERRRGRSDGRAVGSRRQRFSAWNRRRSASSAAASSGRSTASTLVDMAAEGCDGDQSRTRPSRSISTTPAIRPRIASRSLTPRRATSTRSAWRGTTRAARTTDSTRRFPGGVRSPSPVAAVSAPRPPPHLDLPRRHHRARLGLSRSSRSSDVVVHGVRRDDGGRWAWRWTCRGRRPTSSSRS